MDARPTCFACFRPVAHCQCGLIPTMTAHCRLLVLQHPHERRKYYSTARLLVRAVAGARLLRGVVFAPGEIEEALAGTEGFLLFPSPTSRPCEGVALSSNTTVIVLDGTWSEAGKIYHRNPFLQRLPTISFAQPLRSNYRIRKQPKEHCLSTIESVAHMLRLNALGQGRAELVPQYQALLAGFDAMVERQLRHFPRFSGVANDRRRSVSQSAALL